MDIPDSNPAAGLTITLLCSMPRNMEEDAVALAVIALEVGNKVRKADMMFFYG